MRELPRNFVRTRHCKFNDTSQLRSQNRAGSPTPANFPCQDITCSFQTDTVSQNLRVFAKSNLTARSFWSPRVPWSGGPSIAACFSRRVSTRLSISFTWRREQIFRQSTCNDRIPCFPPQLAAAVVWLHEHARLPHLCVPKPSCLFGRSQSHGNSHLPFNTWVQGR